MGDEKAASLQGVGAAKRNKSGPAGVLKSRSVTGRGRVGWEESAFLWCQTRQGLMGNSLPAWTSSLQGVLPPVEQVCSLWEHGETLKENR